MKFYCEQCNTKYSIAEEKVRGKVLKVRCKNCGNIITVRDPESPTPAATDKSRSSPPKPPAAALATHVPQTNWYYSVNGQSSPPMNLSELKERYESGQLGDESYVWHESIVEWKPVRDVEIFAEALRKGQAIKPRTKTVGFTGQLEAIKVAEAPKGPQVGVAPSSQRTPEKRAKLDTSMPGAAEPAAREDRLDRLREKLKNDVPKPSTLSVSKPGIPELQADLDFEPTVDVEKPDFGTGESNAELTFASSVQHAKRELPAFNPKPVTSSTSNVFESPIEDEIPEPDDSGLIPFFPEAPKLESSMKTATSGGQDMSQSLLIRIDEMQATNRKQRRNFILVGVLGLCILGAVIRYALTRPTAPILPPEDVLASKAQKARRPVEGTYSAAQLKKFELNLDEEVIGPEERAEDLQQMVATADLAPNPMKQAEALVKRSEKSQPKMDAVSSANGTSTESIQQRKLDEPAKMGTVTADGPAPLKGREALLSYESATTRRDPVAMINRPSDQLTAPAARPKLLSREEARKGFKLIRQSVSVCRDRHMRRGATFNAKKIVIGITVQPEGRVSDYTVEPAEIQHTEFDACMQSHMDRWKFAPWDGVETQINSSFVIQ